jgi:hypothetical protein
MMWELIRKAVDGWTAWRVKQRLYRAMPERRDLDRQIAARKRGHRSSAVLVRELKRSTTNRLRMEVGQ